MISAKRFGIRSFSKLLSVNPVVKEALASKKPVIALESTVITHGLPYPRNLRVAKSLEQIARDEGVTPATIALLDGKVCVGLDEEQLDHLASPNTRAVKVSTRDIPTVLAEKTTGSTTVAATMKIADWAGIRIFATGGIGGVHRGAEDSFDVSADLVELGRTPVAVVCAGAKSILDIRKTLEVLETNGVNVIVLDSQPYFPGFFVSRTEFKAPYHTTSIPLIADILKTTDRLNLRHGTLVACPLPEELTKDGDAIGNAVEQALKEAEESQIVNKDLTPFLLKRVDELTDSASLKINVALLENNVRMASRLAQEYVKRERGVITGQNTAPARSEAPPKVLCVGASILDFEVVSALRPQNDGGSYPGTLHCRAGGVARNHAECLHKLSNQVSFISAIGDDEAGAFLKQMGLYFVPEDQIICSQTAPTASYLSVNVQGNIAHGYSSIDAIVGEIVPSEIQKRKHLFEDVDCIVVDGNISTATFQTVCDIAREFKKRVWFDTTDIAKVERLNDDILTSIWGISPNQNEFKRYCNLFNFPQVPEDVFQKSEHLADYFYKRLSLTSSLFPANLHKFLITLGEAGVVLLSRSETNPEIIEIRSVEAPNFQNFVSASGAGDCFNSGFLSSYLRGNDDETSLVWGQKTAGLSLQSLQTVPETIDIKAISELEAAACAA
ncbi:unnamed protein product [Bursaphelenchus okinawaensis]|uniref:Carbohydrate kinase PfkB domain-containing protein n=1 Tax=Bursaphelenchus okinawaensis TaxID=465554 RepID=A0A811LND2_9BILA|nr:unnamed protein product [Bursaphelenchus okinawaensis]CAG9125331.1 unnamed protein product [Bursaphelenchus okinawaensis]